jgi:ATP-dependent Zn protease
MTQPTVLLVVLLEQRWKIQKIKKLVAYHEVGHAIVGSVLENHDEVEK